MRDKHNVTLARVRRVIHIGGESAAVKEAGSGAPVVLLPSQLVISRAYKPTIAALARRFKVITVEMPGVGGASRLREPWGENDYAEWLAKFLAEMNLTRPTIIGHSNSAPAALLMAVKYPQFLGRLVLADPVGADPFHSILRVLAGRAIDAGIELQLSVSGWPHILFNLAHHPRNFLRQIKLAVDADMIEAARCVKVPALLAWGRRDFTMRPAWAKRLLDALPDGRMYWSSHGSHDWLITHPDEFAAAVGAFLRRRRD